MARDNKPEEYFIPANITDNGNYLGGADKRRVAEMGVIAGVGFLISFGVFGFLGILKDIIIFFPFLILVAFAYVGFKGEPLFEYLISYFFYKRKIRTMKYRLPRPDAPEKQKKFGVKKKEEKL